MNTIRLPVISIKQYSDARSVKSKVSSNKWKNPLENFQKRLSKFKEKIKDSSYINKSLDQTNNHSGKKRRLKSWFTGNNIRKNRQSFDNPQNNDRFIDRISEPFNILEEEIRHLTLESRIHR